MTPALNHRQEKIKHMPQPGLARPGGFAHSCGQIGTEPMQRKRAIAIAVAQRQERVRVLTLAAGLLLLPAALLLLLISP